MDDSVDAEQVPLTLAQVHRRVQSTPLPPPMQDPELLPVADLDPKVFERLVAEVIARGDHRGVQIYGRNGQSQYGLDIVARERDGTRSLYQVKRFQELSGKDLRAAVRRYAGPPRSPDYDGEPRRFAARRFVVVTSAELDSDAGNVDTLAALQDEYEGDLDIEAWGAEALSRTLRTGDSLVYAIFGPEWSKLFCGYEPKPPVTVGPKPLGLVESPVEVLGLELTEADANAAEATDPLAAARLFGAVAQGLSAGGFPGHAAAVRKRQATAALAGGDRTSAFTTTFEIALDQVLAGWSLETYGLLRELAEMASPLGEVHQAQCLLLSCAAKWYEEGTKLAEAVQALRVLAEANSSHLAVLSCLILEQALVDGLYESLPPRSATAAVNDGSTAYLAELRAIAGKTDSRDVAIRARLRCAIADSNLPLEATSAAVGEFYDSVLRDALAGRLRHAAGLVASRAAYAYAMHGDPEHADDLWRRAVLSSSEHGDYGDVIGALRASRRLAFERNHFSSWPAIDTNALPNRQRLLAAAFDPALATLEAAHVGKLTNAYRDARRYLWESRLAGHLQDEQHALALFGDVVAVSGAHEVAVEFYVRSDEPDKAVALARQLPVLADVDRWITSPVRRCRAAVVQVVGAQAAMVEDRSVPDRIEALLNCAANLWEAPWIHPQPELESLKAIAAFAVRIPASAVDRILSIATPALTAATLASDDVANLLVQTYWAVTSRRPDVAKALMSMLRLPEPPPSLWGRIWNMPDGAREPLLQGINDMADEGSPEAIAALASWRLPTVSVQLAARRACAALLRWPIGDEAETTFVGAFDSRLPDLLLTLLEADAPIEVPLFELRPEVTPPVAHALFTVARVAPPKDDSGPVAADAPEPEPTASLLLDGTAGPDEAALIAAGPLDELVAAVVTHLVDLARDEQKLATGRVSVLHVLRPLIPQTPKDVAASLALALAELHQAPNYSEIDLLEMSTNHALSRTRINSGAHQLPGLALLAAVELFAASQIPTSPPTDGDDFFADQAVASAMLLLRHPDPHMRQMGGISIMILSSLQDRLAPYATGLLFHGDEEVRAMAAGHASLAPYMLAGLAADPSTAVRVAVARRGSQLPVSARDALAEDPDLAVRHALEHSS